MGEPLIQNVSDTARWVAVYRAWESERPDALFRDPFAARLAGDKGRQIAASIRRGGGTQNGWPMITRTKLIDDLVLESIAQGCDCVLNLAAGFDTRPYRLALPADLPWIELDLPALIEEKESALANEKPACALERHKLDLSDRAARGAFFDRVAERFQRVLVISEGLVVYLDESAVRELGFDLKARASFRFWMLDLVNRKIIELLAGRSGPALQNAPMKFGPDNGIAFFEALGWKARDVRSLYREGVRLKRVPWAMRLFAFLPDPDPRKPGKNPWSAVVRFEQPAS